MSEQRRVSAAILGLGTNVPSATMTQRQFADFLEHTLALDAQAKRFVDMLCHRSGISRRAAVILDSTAPDDQPLRQVGYGTGPSSFQLNSTKHRIAAYTSLATPLAEHAARAALTDARLSPAGITHIVTASCTGMASPGVDLGLIRALGLKPNVSRTHVGFMGCHAAVNAIRVADGFARADAGARVLVVCVELCSLHLLRSDRREHLLSAMLFADGASAVIVGQEPEAALTIRSTASTVIPDSDALMGWTIGDDGFVMSLDERVPEAIAQATPSWIDEWLNASGSSLREMRTVAQWGVHPGGPRILQSVRQSLGLPDDALSASESVLNDYGNMSSATLVFILDRLRKSKTLPEEVDSSAVGSGDVPRQPMVLIAFGPGLCGEALLLERPSPSLPNPRAL